MTNLYREFIPIVADTGSQSQAIPISEMLTGVLTTPSALTATTVIGFTACTTQGGTFTTCYDQYGALIYLTVAVNAAGHYDIPLSIMKNSHIKIFTCTTAGVAVAQAAERTFGLICKG
jgi:hypothetical protein